MQRKNCAASSTQGDCEGMCEGSPNNRVTRSLATIRTCQDLPGSARMEMVAQQGGAEVAPNCCCCCCCCGARHLLRYFCPIVAVVAVPIEFLRDEITSTPSISISATFQICIQLLHFARFNIPHS